MYLYHDAKFICLKLPICAALKKFSVYNIVDLGLYIYFVFYPNSDLIFVTNLTNQVSGEKICHVENFQHSMHDDCGKI